MKTTQLFAMAFLPAALLVGEAHALTASPAPIAKPAPILKVNGHVHRHRQSLFRNWCAYNCYAVPRCARCYGQYGYSRFAYDEDLPFRYRCDPGASPIDNADAFVYRVTGEPFMRAFERIY